MSALLLLTLMLTPILGLTLIGAIVGRRRRLETAEIAFSRPLSALVGDDHDLLPESGTDGGQNGLAAFYAYQMGAGRAHRH